MHDPQGIFSATEYFQERFGFDHEDTEDTEEVQECETCPACNEDNPTGKLYTVLGETFCFDCGVAYVEDYAGSDMTHDNDKYHIDIKIANRLTWWYPEFRKVLNNWLDGLHAT